MSDAVLTISGLTVEFATEDGVVHAVQDVSYSVQAGKTLAIVGESGSGKTVSSLAVMGLLTGSNVTISGSAIFDGNELVGADPETVRSLRGKRMAMIFQDPLSSLNPYYTVGDQLVEAIQVHNNVSDEVARDRAIAMLSRVGIAQAGSRADDFPHQLSGGMRQRAMIAMALVNDPELLIADEPTTALDVTVQAQILELLRDLQREMGVAIVLITHDLGVVADMADEVAVMYGGSVVEQAPVREIFYEPQMPYTWGLLGSIPQLQSSNQRLDTIPGIPPSLINVPAGCVFAPRCEFTDSVGGACFTTKPTLDVVSAGHSARCHLSAGDRAQLRPQLRQS